MAPAGAEVALVHLKNCLVNLPSSLVSVLSNANTVRRAFLNTIHEPGGNPYSYSPALGCTKCCRRATISLSNTRFRSRFQRWHPKVNLRGMDRTTKQVDS